MATLTPVWLLTLYCVLVLLASLMGGGSKYIREVDDLLTLEGLRIIYERNLPQLRRRSEHSHTTPAAAAPIKRS